MNPFARFLSTVAIVALMSAAAYAQTKGATLFRSNCVMCHGADGTGNTPTGQALKVSNLHSPAVVKLSNAQLANVIKNGKNSMPAFGARLSSTQIESLVAYIRQLQKK